MRATRRLAVVAGAVAGAMIFGTGTASADHAHFIYQPAHGEHPATCRYIGEGQTAKAADDPGGHAFHEHVHTGRPGSDEHGTDVDKEGNAAHYDCVWVDRP